MVKEVTKKSARSGPKTGKPGASGKSGGTSVPKKKISGKKKVSREETESESDGGDDDKSDKDDDGSDKSDSESDVNESDDGETDGGGAVAVPVPVAVPAPAPAPAPDPDQPSFALGSEHKDYLGDFYKIYLTKKGKKGQRNGMTGKKYVDQILPDVFDRFYGDLSEEQRERYTPQLHRKVYNWFNNKRNAENKIKSHLKKISPENLWFKDDPSIVNKAIDAIVEADDLSVVKIGLFRQVLCAEFKNQSAAVKKEYEAKAENERRMAESVDPLEGAEREKLALKMIGDFKKMAKDGYKVANILLTMHVAYEKEATDGSQGLQVLSVATPRIKGYMATQDHQDSAAAFAEYLREELQSTVPDKEPEPAIVPDRNDQCRPIIPDIGLEPLLPWVRNTVRQALTAYWHDAGGVGAVPWTEIIKSVEKGEEKWVLSSRLPDPEEAPFVDPGKLRLDQGVEWLKHLSKRQDGAPEDKRFQWQQVYGGTKPPPPWSAACKPYTTALRRRNRRVYVLRYVGFIRQSQAAIAIPYSENTWKWLAHTKGEKDHAKSWMGLPSKAVNDDDLLVDGGTVDIIKGWFGDGWDEISKLVEELMESVNKSERFGPAESSEGLWHKSRDGSDELPSLFPSTIPGENGISQFLQQFWIVKDYFRSPRKSAESGNMDYLEEWIEKTLSGGPIWHTTSGTFLGGQRGIVWVVLGLVKVLANVGASIGRFDKLVEPPANYELDRMTERHWNRIVFWLGKLKEALAASRSILAKTASQRLRPAESSDAEDLEEAEGGDDAGDAPVAPEPTARRQQPKRKATKQPNPDISHPSSSSSSPGSDSETYGTPARKGAQKKKGGDADDADVDVTGVDEEGGDEKGANDGDSDEEELVKKKGKGGKRANASKQDSSARKRRKTDTSAAQAGADSTPAPDDDPLAPYLPLSPIDYVTRANTFGPFAAPETFQKPTCDIAELIPMVNSAFVTAKSVMVSWEDAKSEIANPYSVNVIKRARELAAGVQTTEEERSLAEAILIHRGMRSNAGKQWPMVRTHHLAMMNCWRQGSAIGTRIDVVLKEIGGANPKHPRYDELRRARKVLFIRLFALRFLFTELKDLDRLSTKWANELQDCWEEDVITWDPIKMLETVRSIAAWRDETVALVQEARESRLELWNTKTYEKLEPLPKGSWYHFGNPFHDALDGQCMTLLQVIPKDYPFDPANEWTAVSDGNPERAQRSKSLPSRPATPDASNVQDDPDVAMDTDDLPAPAVPAAPSALASPTAVPSPVAESAEQDPPAPRDKDIPGGGEGAQDNAASTGKNGKGGKKPPRGGGAKKTGPSKDGRQVKNGNAVATGSDGGSGSRAKSASVDNSGNAEPRKSLRPRQASKRAQGV